MRLCTKCVVKYLSLDKFEKLNFDGSRMSAMGQKPTNGPQQKYDFVRFGPKADIRRRERNVREVPEADLAAAIAVIVRI